MQFISKVFPITMGAAAVLFSLLAILWAYFLWSRRKFYAFAFKMPGPSGLPILGIAHKIYKVADLLYELPKFAYQYKSKTYFTWFGTYPLIYTMEPKFAELVLNSPDCLNKSILYEVGNDIVGDGLVTSKCPRWNKHRKLLSHCFYHKTSLQFFPEFNIFAHEVCETFDKLVNCGEIDVKDYLYKLTLKSTLAITMGIDCKQESGVKFMDHFERLSELAIERGLKPWLANSIALRFSSLYKPYMESRNFILNFIREAVKKNINLIDQQGLKELNSKTNSSEESVNIQKPKFKFIDQAIKIHQKNEFTIDDIVQESNTILLASFETTATTLYSTLMLLAMYPKYQELVYEEIVTAFPEKEFNVTFEDFDNLVYLNMCINETLRIAPTGPLIARESMNDVPISKDIVIPKGTQIGIDIFNIHRDEDIWGPDAKIFNPDHFLPEGVSDKNKYSFIPFSKGPRNCVGWQYAQMIMKVALAQILRKYHFSTSFPYEDLRFVYFGTLRYQKVPYLEIQRRPF